MKSSSLKTKWTIITTTITFIIIMVFSLLIIFFMGMTLKSEESINARTTLIKASNLFKSQNIGELSIAEVDGVLNRNQHLILYDAIGNQRLVYPESKILPEFKPVTRAELSEEIVNNERSYITRTPIHTDYVDGYITIVHSLNRYEETIQFMTILASVFGVMALFVTAMISYLFSNQITKPIRRLSVQMKQIQRDGFQQQLTMPTSYYETDDMIETFNNMMTQLEEVFNSQKQFVEDASHELRTPLQIIQGHLNLINRWGKNDPEILKESLNISLDEMNRITKLVEELLLLTKEDKVLPDATEQVDVNAEIESRVYSLKALHPEYKLEVYTKKLRPINISRYQFEQMLLIFLDNAIKYDTINKHIVVRTYMKNRKVQIEIIDHGQGIPKDSLNSVFDRFYRVDKSRARNMGGNGLGLSIAKKIIESNHGTVRIESEENKYTRVIITFED